MSILPIDTENLIFALIIILLICGIVQLIIIIRLYRRYKDLGAQEKTLKEKYEQLNKQLTERSEKYQNLNNQLYDEIAKHEITEELVIETQNYMQSIINSMPSVLIGVSRDGRVTHWNAAAKEETNISYQQALGRLLENIAPQLNISLTAIETAIDKKQPQKRESIQEGHGSNARYKDITIYPLLSAGVDGAVIRVDDVTMRIRLETMMIQNEKMGSLGELAAGVAHEINNPLGTILQGVQNIQRRLSNTLPSNKDTADSLDLNFDSMIAYLEKRKILPFLVDIKEAGERAGKIVTNMLEFSRATHYQHEQVHLVDLLNRAIDLSSSSTVVSKDNRRVKIKIDKSFPDDCPLIYGSAAEIQQVILNLLSNAYHAFKEYAQNANANELKLTVAVNLQFYNSHAIITIEDNGPGMDEWTQRLSLIHI